MVKNCRKLKKEKETRKCYKCDKVKHLAKNCRWGQKMKNKNIQEESENKDKEDNSKEVDFVKGSEYAVWQTFAHSKSLKNWYVILQRRDNKERELNEM